jgi:hypothetical protein
MWFTEDPWPPVLICGLVALIGLGLWASSKRVLHLGIVAVAALAAIGFVLLEQSIVTDAERIEAQVRTLCTQFQLKDQALFEHFSPQAPELRTMVGAALALVTVEDDLSLTDFQTKLTNQGSRATCHFRANATISLSMLGKVGRQPARFELTFAKEGDAWKIIEVKRLNPLNGKEMGVLDQNAG